jgi:hypothetical protein
MGQKTDMQRVEHAMSWAMQVLMRRPHVERGLIEKVQC